MKADEVRAESREPQGKSRSVNPRCRSLVASFALALMLLSGCASAPAAKTPVGTSYAFWPPPPAEPRIQFVRSFAKSSDVNPRQESALERAIFGRETEASIDILKPYGVAMRDGRIYVCDTRNARVTVLDVMRKQTRIMGATGQMALSAPLDVAIADDGMIYVVDRGRGIVVYSPDERPVKMLTLPDLKPMALTVHADRLYVTCMASQCVVALNRNTGALIETLGTVGDKDGQFRLALGIAADARGDLHVVDMMRCRLQKFSRGRGEESWQVVAAVGERTDTAGNFVRPKHVAVDREGLVYVVDAAFDNVQVFDVYGSQYRLLTSFGGPGWHPGAMNLPAGIFVLHDGVELFRDEIHPYFEADRLIVVTNQFGRNKVAVYALGQLREGKTLKDIEAHMAVLDPDVIEPGESNPLADLTDEALLGDDEGSADEEGR
jgi:sugar lactone lactonase YvrE